MAFAPPAQSPQTPRPELGQNLIVIHDFAARSSDELSLSKGEIIELIERDDDFGDGWYLGRCLQSGNSGLFPQVYTRIAPPGGPSNPPTPATALSAGPAAPAVPATPTGRPVSYGMNPAPIATPSTGYSVSTDSSASITTPDTDQDRPITPNATTPETMGALRATPPLNTPVVTPAASNNTATSTNVASAVPASLSLPSAARSSVQGQESPVMNETLSVIDEHITDMNAPHRRGPTERRAANDSGSEYSSNLDARLSYINGHETDEEEGDAHTRDEVVPWTPDQVAAYLSEAGVEAKHCEVFREQEITGEVLLGMDQTSVFLKEFDLGSVGRRLKTWQKIKALQDEVSGESQTRRNTATYGSDAGSDDAARNRSRSEASTLASAPTFPRIAGLVDRPISRQNTRLSQQQLSRNNTLRQSPALSNFTQDSPRATGENRPSAASIRDLHHSRQNSASATDFGAISPGTSIPADASSPTLQDGHKKQSSFDRTWTMGDALSPPLSTPGRPLSSSGSAGFSVIVGDHDSKSALDRGYLSGGEVEGRQRNVLRKRAGSSTTNHSRNSSYTAVNQRHSRFGSVDSVRDNTPPSASQKYYGLAVNNRSTRRTPSESSINAPPRPPPPPKDFPSPTMNRLQGIPYEKAAAPLPTTRQGGAADWLLPIKPLSASRHFGLRAISDAVTGHERSKVTSPTDSLPSLVKESLESPSTRTGSSTPSGGQSLDLDSPDGKGTSGMTLPGSRSAKKKSKKETSAYTRGLEKKTPQEQMIGADYSGRMRKKSSNLMATWKPRLFILKGRRLSYYYSEDDTEERGLIDISFHKVLPADNERLTGLHATLSGALSSPTSPHGTLETIAGGGPSDPKVSGESMFIFKLQPPKAGLARAVNFTKPTVHYFAVPNITIGRLWMAALVKATIDRDDSQAVVTTYQQKTISLEKARKMRHRPPALMNLDEHADEETLATPSSDKHGLNIQGIIFDRESHEGDSGVSGVSRPDKVVPESAGLSNGRGEHSSEEVVEDLEEPKTA